MAFSVHPTLRGKPQQWSAEFAKHWQTRRGSLADLRDHVCSGGAFVCAQMTGATRRSDAFSNAELVAVDIDHGLRLSHLADHPLHDQIAFVYTTPSHTEEHHRFRVVFQLPEIVCDAAYYKAIATTLTHHFGGDEAARDACRLFYGNASASVPIFQPEAVLSQQLMEEALQLRLEWQRQEQAWADEDHEITPEDIARAQYCLEQIIPPTSDGDYETFAQVTSGAAAAGSALFESWKAWARRGHHGSSSRHAQSNTSESKFRSFNRGKISALFAAAKEADPDWFRSLPSELKGTAAGFANPPGVAGYSWEDLYNPQLTDLDEPWECDEPQQAGPRTQSLFDDDLDLEIPDAPPDPSALAAPPAAAPTDADDIELPGYRFPQTGVEMGDAIVASIRAVYPQLRLNSLSREYEYGNYNQPQTLDREELRRVHLRISAGQDKFLNKELCNDLVHEIAGMNRYNPARLYVQTVSKKHKPCNYFDRLASELIGIKPNEALGSPVLPTTGRLIEDEILRRFLIGAVARLMEPGCAMDWMPILVGSQACGKSNFFNYLTPPSPLSSEHPWTVTIQQSLPKLIDRPHALHAGFIILLDECERYFTRSGVENLKNLVSVASDRSAPKFQEEQNFPRSFVLCGAANNADILIDPTGNRRFLPLSVVGKVPSKENPNIRIIDLDRLKLDRNAIWSAAYQAYMDREPHNFSSYELSCMAEYIRTFEVDDPTETQVANALRDVPPFQARVEGKTRKVWILHDLLKSADIPDSEFTKVRQPWTDSLKRLGYRKAKATLMTGGRKNIWYQAD